MAPAKNTFPRPPPLEEFVVPFDDDVPVYLLRHQRCVDVDSVEVDVVEDAPTEEFRSHGRTDHNMEPDHAPKQTWTDPDSVEFDLVASPLYLTGICHHHCIAV